MNFVIVVGKLRQRQSNRHRAMRFGWLCSTEEAIAFLTELPRVLRLPLKKYVLMIAKVIKIEHWKEGFWS